MNSQDYFMWLLVLSVVCFAFMCLFIYFVVRDFSLRRLARTMADLASQMESSRSKVLDFSSGEQGDTGLINFGNQTERPGVDAVRHVDVDGSTVRGTSRGPRATRQRNDLVFEDGQVSRRASRGVSEAGLRQLLADRLMIQGHMRQQQDVGDMFGARDDDFSPLSNNNNNRRGSAMQVHVDPYANNNNSDNSAQLRMTSTLSDGMHDPEGPAPGGRGRARRASGRGRGGDDALTRQPSEGVLVGAGGGRGNGLRREFDSDVPGGRGEGLMRRESQAEIAGRGNGLLRRDSQPEISAPVAVAPRPGRGVIDGGRSAMTPSALEELERLKRNLAGVDETAFDMTGGNDDEMVWPSVRPPESSSTGVVYHDPYRK
jgi:hypothetical protein